MDFSINKRTSIVIQIIFWILYFMLVYKLLEANGLDGFSTFIQSCCMVIVFAVISYLNALYLIPKFFTNKKYFIYFLLITLLIALTPIALLWVMKTIYNYYHSIIGSPLSISNPERGRYMRILIPTIIFLFSSTTLRLILDFSKNERQRIKIEKERLLAETKFLRSQMNPHFFLNALNNLNAIIRLSPSKSESYINALADMMRYVTYDCKKSWVPLRQEISYINNYIYAQQIKDDEIAITFRTNIENEEAQIEPMLLIPFVENAFKHGGEINGEFYPINIHIEQAKNRIRFTCKNKINPLSTKNSDPSYSGVGIKNVKERLQASYPNMYDLSITEKDSMFLVSLILYSGVRDGDE
jgi:sensor histidine kinase YesM